MQVFRKNDLIKANHHYGLVLEKHVCAGHECEDGRRVRVPLRSPLYEVVLDVSRKVGWVNPGVRQIWIEEGRAVYRLFPDELEFVARSGSRRWARLAAELRLPEGCAPALPAALSAAVPA